MTKEIKQQGFTDNTIKVNLSVLDRYYLHTILPDHGSIAEIELGEAILKRVSFSQKEVEEYEIAYLPENRMAHNPSKAKIREFRFESYELLFIQQGVREYEETKMIRPWNKNLAKKMLAIVVKTKK